MANYNSKDNQFPRKKQVDIPSYLSEITPEEYAFILLKRTHAHTAKKRVQQRTRLIQISDLRPAINALQNTYPTSTFIEQFNQAARRGELV